jgi:O-antigen ligase
MIWLLGGYMWLYTHRPFEIWPTLGELQIERGYMVLTLLLWLVTPGKSFSANRLHAALAIFALALCITWVLSPYAGLPACLEVVENFFKVAVFYLLVVTTVRSERDLRRLVIMFLGAMSLYLLHSFWEYIGGRYEWRMGTRRMVAVAVTNADANAFAASILYALPMLLPFWLERPRRLPRGPMLGFAGLGIFCILLTGSRSGLIGLVALSGMVLVLLSKRKLQAVLLAGIGGALALLLLSVALPGDLQTRYMTIVDSNVGPANARASAEGRLAGFLRGIEIWQESLLLGHGPGSFAKASGHGAQAHNVYGQVLSEMGIVGGLAFLALLAGFLFNWLETRRLHTALAGPGGPPDFLVLLVRSVGLAVLLLLLLGMAGHNLFRHQWQWFAAFQAVAVAALRLRASARDDAELAGWVPAPAW